MTPRQSVDDVEYAEAPSVVKLIGEEIERPTPIGFGFHQDQHRGGAGCARRGICPGKPLKRSGEMTM